MSAKRIILAPRDPLQPFMRGFILRIGQPGAIGGLGGGQLLQALLPVIVSAAAGGGLDLGAIVGQVGGGGAAILTVIAGLVKSMTVSQQTR
jgi:hypothetical protein